MNRRDFLHWSGLVAVSGLLQACGGGAAAPASAPPASSAPATAASAKPVGSGAAASAKPAASAAASSSAAAKPGSKLVVSYGSTVGSFAPLWMAQQIGAFGKYGIDVDMRFVESTAAVAAQIAGQIHAQEVSAAPVITADVNGNEDLVFIASDLNHPIISLYASADIKTAADLKGKAVGSGLPGSPVEYATLLALSLLGLKPTDVEIRRLGPNQVLPGMIAGQMPAGSLAPPENFQAEAKGFHLLQDITSQPYQNVGLVARRSRLDELGTGLRGLVAAYRDGIQAMFDQPDVAIKVQGDYAKVTDADVLKKTYDFYTKTAPYQKDMQPTIAGIQAMIDFLGQSADKVKGHKPDEFVDLRFLKDLPKA